MVLLDPPLIFPRLCRFRAVLPWLVQEPETFIGAVPSVVASLFVYWRPERLQTFECRTIQTEALPRCMTFSRGRNPDGWDRLGGRLEVGADPLHAPGPCWRFRRAPPEISMNQRVSREIPAGICLDTSPRVAGANLLTGRRLRATHATVSGQIPDRG